MGKSSGGAGRGGGGEWSPTYSKSIKLYDKLAYEYTLADGDRKENILDALETAESIAGSATPARDNDENWAKWNERAKKLLSKK